MVEMDKFLLKVHEPHFLQYSTSYYILFSIVYGDFSKLGAPISSHASKSMLETHRYR
jgi:hypothetical protein